MHELDRLREDPFEWLMAACAAESPEPLSQPETPRLISVIVPLYNGSAYLERCLESISAQEVDRYQVEVLVCEDGSHDRSLEVAQALAPRQRHETRVFSHPDGRNHGVCATRNLGAAEARGEFLALLDADDLWLPGKLARQMRVFEEGPAVECVCSFGFNKDLAGRPVRGWSGGEWAGDFRCAAPPEDFRGPYDFEQLLRGDPVLNSSVVMRRAAFARAGGYPRTMSHQAEDWLLWLKLSLSAPIAVVEEPLIDYTVHEDSYTARYVRDGYGFGARHEVMAFLLHWMAQREEYRERARELYRKDWPQIQAGMSGTHRVVAGFLREHPERGQSVGEFERYLNGLEKRQAELEAYRAHIEGQLDKLRRVPGLAWLYRTLRRAR